MKEKAAGDGDTTEERILEAALDVIEEKTISGTRLRLIADRAGLFQSNIHYYYKSKRELLLTVQRKVLARCIDLRSAEREQGLKEDFDTQIDVFIHQKREFILKLRKYDYAEMDFWVQARSDCAIRAEFAGSFRNWREEIAVLVRRFAPDMPQKEITLCAALFVSILEGATIQYLIDEQAFNLDDYFDMGKAMLKERMNFAGSGSRQG